MPAQSHAETSIAIHGVSAAATVRQHRLPMPASSIVHRQLREAEGQQALTELFPHLRHEAYNALRELFPSQSAQ